MYVYIYAHYKTCTERVKGTCKKHDKKINLFQGPPCAPTGVRHPLLWQPVLHTQWALYTETQLLRPSPFTSAHYCSGHLPVCWIWVKFLRVLQICSLFSGNYVHINRKHSWYLFTFVCGPIYSDWFSCRQIRTCVYFFQCSLEWLFFLYHLTLWLVVYFTILF